MMLDSRRAKHNPEDELHMTWTGCGSELRLGTKATVILIILIILIYRIIILATIAKKKYTICPY